MVSFVPWTSGEVASAAKLNSNYQASNDFATAADTAAATASAAARNVINVRNYGAKGDGSTDDTAAIQAAIAAVPVNGGRVEFPAGIYMVSAPLAITNGSTTVTGAGTNVTHVRSTSTTADVFTVGTNAVFTTISYMSIDRSVTTTTGYGIHFLGGGSGTYSRLSDLYVARHARGIHLTSSTYGWVTRCIIESNGFDGVFMTNDTQGACQWQITDSISQGNGGNGWRVFAQTGLGSSQITLGTWTNVASYANTGYGVSFEGASACPVQDIRLMNSFLGEDANGEVNIDTYGQSHLISNLFTELAGTQATGVGFVNPATGFGHGVVITANNADTTITGGTHVANSQSGIYNNGANTTITGVSFQSNGQNSDTAIASNCGIYNAGGNLTLSASTFKGNPYGVYSTTDTLMVSGNTIRPSAGTGTAQAIVNASGTTTSSIITPNRLIAP